MHSATVSGHELILSGWNIKAYATAHGSVGSKLDSILESAWLLNVELGVNHFSTVELHELAAVWYGPRGTRSARVIHALDTPSEGLNAPRFIPRSVERASH